MISWNTVHLNWLQTVLVRIYHSSIALYHFLMAEIPEIPADLGIGPSLSNGSEAGSDNNSSKFSKSRNSWGKTSISPKDPNNIAQWNELIRKAEEKYDLFDGPEDQKKRLEQSALSIYKQLLSRFPFLTEHWKQFLVFTYKVSGLKDSLAVLELATKKYPQSVSLWVEYLTALISAGDEFSDATHTDREFEKAKTQIGYHFNSDPFWDMYIAHTSKKDDPKDLLNLYLYLIYIPLYQYAKYYNQFMEMNKTFDVSEIIRDQSHLAELLNNFGKSQASELSTLEKGQLIDECSNSIFTETQTKVNDKWAYESSLVIQDFQPLAAPNAEPWLAYIKHELDILGSILEEDLKSRQIKIVTNLFERAVVPNCFSSEVWLQYSSFAESFLPFDEAKEVYDRAVFSFVPLNEPEVRVKYQNFLIKHEMFDVCNEYLLDLLRLFSGSTGLNIYSKVPYVHSLKQILAFWQEYTPASTMTQILEGLVTGFFERVDRYKKESAVKDKDNEKSTKFELKPPFVTLLSKLLNDDGISVVTVAYLKLLESAGEVVKIRTFFNDHFNQAAFSWSVQFWKFFVEFEGYNQVNLVNLRSIINLIKERSALPQRAVEAFLEIYHEVILKNLKTAILLKGPNGEDLHDTLATIGLEKSHSLALNKPGFRRMANNNAHIKDTEELKFSKNTSNHYSPSLFDREKEFRKFVKKHAFNPGIFQELPEQLPPANEIKFVSLLDEDAEVPELPTIKNLDKAYGPVQYPDE